MLCRIVVRIANFPLRGKRTHNTRNINDTDLSERALACLLYRTTLKVCKFLTGYSIHQYEQRLLRGLKNMNKSAIPY